MIMRFTASSDSMPTHDEQVEDAEADFWSLFGHIPGQGLDCIGDFATREHAEEIFARITGRRYRRTAIGHRSGNR